MFKPKHGGTGTYLYNLWIGIKARVSNTNSPRYKDYGGRGINIAPEWANSFETFKNYVLSNIGNKPSTKYSLDRIDNEKGYAPGNIRWADNTTQRINSRRVHLIEHNGETLPLKTMCDKYGINRATFKDRLSYGWSVKDALETPTMRAGQKRKDKVNSTRIA